MTSTLNRSTYNTVCPRDCYGVCSLTLTKEGERITHIRGNTQNSNSEGFICSKGASYAKRLYQPSRITEPLLKDASGEFNIIDWETALDLLQTKLIHYKDNFGTESVMYLSGWGHAGVFNQYNEGFWSQYGSVTTSYGSLCMAAGSAGLRYTYGQTIKHNHNKDLENAKLIIVWGANPANTNIHRMRAIKKAVAKGAKLIVIDPRVSETMIGDAIRIHPRGGTDGLLAMGVAKGIIERQICDLSFIKENVLGFDAYKDHLENYTMKDIVQITGVSEREINAIVDAIEEEPIYALVSGTGKSRYTNGGQTERAICVLPALTGTLHHSGGGFYFSDDQHPDLKWPYTPKNGHLKKKKIHVGLLAENLERQSPEIKMMWVEKANPITSSPDVNNLKRVFKKLEFLVVVEHFMTDTAELANLILPAAMFAEKDDLIAVYGDAYLHLLQKIVEPSGNCKSEPEIYRMLGEKMGYDLNHLPLVNQDMINDYLRFNNLNTSYEKMREQSFLKEDYKPIAYEDLKFDTPSGKIEIYSKAMEDAQLSPLPNYVNIAENVQETPHILEKFPLHFLTSHASGRINSQFTEMDLSKEKQPILDMHEVDAEKRGISTGDQVLVYNDRGEISLECLVGENIRPGTVHIYEGWGEKYKASVNKLISGRETDMGSGTAFHNSYVQVKVKA